MLDYLRKIELVELKELMVRKVESGHQAEGTVSSLPGTLTLAPQGGGAKGPPPVVFRK